MRMLAAAPFLLAIAAPALASSSDPVAGEGASLRLVSAGPAKADGRVDAVFEITLEPGWKTYWIDPGEAGVPPSLTLADGQALSLRLPAPAVIDEGDLKLVGYDRSVRFVTTLPASSLVEVEAFIGVCEKICVPVGGRLSLDPAHDPGNARDTAIVEEALLALPDAPKQDFAAESVAIDGERLTVTTAVPAGSDDAMLFVASADGWIVGLGEPVSPSQGKAVFALPLARDGDAPWPKDGLLYVMTSGGHAVEGRLPPP